MDPLLLSLPAAFGLAAASGLNASLPLLLSASPPGRVSSTGPWAGAGSDARESEVLKRGR